MSIDLEDTYCSVLGTEEITRAYTLSDIQCFNQLCQNLQQSCSYLERTDKEALNRFSVSLIDNVLKQMDLPVDRTMNKPLRAAKTVMELFVTLCRIPIFRETIAAHNLQSWLQLLRHDHTRYEVTTAINMCIHYMHKAFYHETGYWRRFLTDLAIIGRSSTEHDRVHIEVLKTYYNLLKDDHAFLFECHHSMGPGAFINVLILTCEILDKLYKENREKNQMAEIASIDRCNIRFCVEQLGKFRVELTDKHQPISGQICSQIQHLVGVVGLAAGHRPLYDDSIHDEQFAIVHTCSLLKILTEVWNYVVESRQLNTLEHLPRLFLALNQGIIHLVDESPANRIQAGQQSLQLLLYTAVNFQFLGMNTLHIGQLKQCMVNTCKTLLENCPENKLLLDSIVNSSTDEAQRLKFEQFIANNIDGQNGQNGFSPSDGDEDVDTVDDDEEDEGLDEQYG